MLDTINYGAFVHTFKSGLESVFKGIGIEAKINNPEESHSSGQNLFITTTMGVNGVFNKDTKKMTPFLGVVVISWEKEAFLEVCSKYLGEEITQYSDDVSDISMEIINMVIGNSKMYLDKIDCTLERSLPHFSIDQSLKRNYPSGVHTSVLKGSLSNGNFFLEINVLGDLTTSEDISMFKQ